MPNRRWLTRLHTFRVPWLAMVLLVLAASWVAAEGAALYLRVRFAPVRSKPSLKEGETKHTISVGQKVEVLERSKDGEWVKVKWTEEKKAPEGKEDKEKKAETCEGWIHATLLNTKAPTTETAKTGVAAPEQSLLNRHAQMKKLDTRPLQTLLREPHTNDQLDRFLREGKLGVYREDWPALEGGVTK